MSPRHFVRDVDRIQPSELRMPALVLVIAALVLAGTAIVLGVWESLR